MLRTNEALLLARKMRTDGGVPHHDNRNRTGMSHCDRRNSVGTSFASSEGGPRIWRLSVHPGCNLAVLRIQRGVWP